MRVKRDLFFNSLFDDNESRVYSKKNLDKDFRQWEENISHLDTEKSIVAENCDSKFKKIFVVGLPRSGTTILTQLIQLSINPCVFSNDLAKYYSIPNYAYLNLKVRNDKKLEPISLGSELGHSLAKNQLHEFGYFWQYWLMHRGHDELDEIEISQVDWKGLNSTLNSYMQLNQKDLMIKSVVYNNFIINELFSFLENSYFIYIRRDDFMNAQSLLQSRIKQFGTIDKWWSIKPKPYKAWLSESPIQQVANQVIYTSQKIEGGLECIPNSRYIKIDYRTLISKPNYTIGRIASKFNLTYRELDVSILNQLNYSNSIQLNEEDTSSLKKALIRAKEVFNG